MRNLLHIATLLTLTLTAIPAFSAQSSIVHIQSIAQVENGTTVLYAVGGWGNVANNSCSTGTGVIGFDSTTAVGKSLLSIALAALTANKPIFVFTSDSSCLPVGGMAPTIQRLDIST